MADTIIVEIANEMEIREDLKSVLPFLPLAIRSSTLFWPSQVVEALKAISKGPDQSNVNSGESLFSAISDIRSSLNLFADPLAPFAREGYALFFDELMIRVESENWFRKVVPTMANLLLRLPSLLESHYEHADDLLKNGVRTSLRLLGQQEAGIVFLSQELIGSILACAFFCLFPFSIRGANHLPMINFDHLFDFSIFIAWVNAESLLILELVMLGEKARQFSRSLYESYGEKQENKIKCIIHYFERICSCMPVGYVSFERKVLPLKQIPLSFSYPNADFWSNSITPLCPFEVHNSGFIEDQSNEALEVDFANKYLGGGALNRGCVQEEIRFMISPELIAGMLFLPCMDDNEAIEMVGAERFSNYTGYASSFCFSGDHVDKRNVDSFGRRKTRIIAIDALCSPRMQQYKVQFLLRETNKAFCGFFDQSKLDHYGKLYQDTELQGAQYKQDDEDTKITSRSDFRVNDECSSTSVEIEMNELPNRVDRNSDGKGRLCLGDEDKIGIATGNWGCGAFGGDPELKTIIQWLSASQALRPFISYYTFGIEPLQNLDQVSQWILSHEWTVGDLWNLLVEYSSKRLNKETNVGFFTWLLPSLIAHDAEMWDVSNTP